MYVITFYSFKGGVGRTMALANVGLELARNGSRVLLVDFDLEAPGLDTFEILRPKSSARGIVDFVTEYYQTGSAPVLSEFIYQVPLGKDVAGSLFVMPTGAQDDDYGLRLNSIDWQELYSERDGYVLFEDLKEQWKQSLRPDYVLIDSRTGHTDVGGICTRQLPDAVAVFFFPNQQNLRGLEAVVEAIRGDSSRITRPVQLYFVASNVPNLDDEEGILHDRLSGFREKLNYDGLDGTIHHYDSLALLEQTVFTLERPKTRLAREYRRLAQRILSANLEDRKVALRLLENLETGKFSQRRPDPKKVDDLLKSIRSLYASDGEVLYRLAGTNRYLGREEVAERLMAEAEALGYETEEMLVARAREAYQQNDIPRARSLIERAITKPGERLFTREAAVEVVAKHDSAYLRDVVPNLLGSNPDPAEALVLATQLMGNLSEIREAEMLLRNAMAIVMETDPDSKRALANQLSLCLIAQQRFTEAKTLIAPERSQLAGKAIAEVFNYAMAEWGETEQPPRDLFRRVLEMPSPEIARRAPNFFQCLAIASWACGDNDAAIHCARKADALIDASGHSFSAWRYLDVGTNEFRRDVAALVKFIETGAGKPQVFSGQMSEMIM